MTEPGQKSVAAAFVPLRVLWIKPALKGVAPLGAAVFVGSMAELSILMLGNDEGGRASTAFFAAAASIVTVLTLGYFAQVAAVTGLALKALQRLSSMLPTATGGTPAVAGDEPQELVAAALNSRVKIVEHYKRPAAKAVGTLVGVGAQFLLCQAVVLYSIAAQVTSRWLALMVGVELVVLFGCLTIISVGAAALGTLALADADERSGEATTNTDR